MPCLSLPLFQKCTPPLSLLQTWPSRVPPMDARPSADVDGAWATSATATALTALRRALDIRTAASLERGATPPHTGAERDLTMERSHRPQEAAAAPSMLPGPRHQTSRLCLPPGVVSGAFGLSPVGSSRGPSGGDRRAARAREAEVVAALGPSAQQSPLALATGRGSSLEREPRSTSRSSTRSSVDSQARD